MAKKYRRIFYNLFAWPSVEHLSEDDQLDMLTADLGDDGPIKAAELKLYDTRVILDRILTAAQQEIQQARERADTPKWLIPLMDRIITLARACLDCEASTALPQREALPMLMLKLGRLIEAADLSEPFGDGIKSMNSQNRRFSVIAELNAKKGQAMEHARNIAREKWALDTGKKIKITEMAEHVYKALVTEGYLSELPGDSFQLKGWIASVAPDYARKGGRPSKTP